jgi:translation initiation factor 1 (eIF-1/SUI1)
LKTKRKATTIIEGYEGDEDFKILAKEIKTKLSGGFAKMILLSFKGLP